MKIEIYTACPFCGTNHLTIIPIEDYEKWQAGELIQNAFPYLSASEREILKTGICPSCWDKMFPPEEEEEPEEFDYDFADTYMEIGFNPYMGCYDWDE